MQLKKWITPFEEVSKNTRLLILIIWIAIIVGYWFLSSLGTKHLFPTPFQVLDGLKEMYANGLVHEIAKSLGLCFMAVVLSLLITMLVVYLSPLALISPLAYILSKVRYLPLAGITYYLAVTVSNARTMQIWFLAIFMSLFFITSMLAVLKDIPEEEINHAKSLGCTRWEILFEVVIKGRLDYLFEVLRQNLAIVWMLIVTVESLVISSGGMGVLIKNAERGNAHGKVVAIQIIILLIGLTLDYILTLCRKNIFRYSTY